jgi:hypothetical protein
MKLSFDNLKKEALKNKEVNQAYRFQVLKYKFAKAIIWVKVKIKSLV